MMWRWLAGLVAMVGVAVWIGRCQSRAHERRLAKIREDSERRAEDGVARVRRWSAYEAAKERVVGSATLGQAFQAVGEPETVCEDVDRVISGARIALYRCWWTYETHRGDKRILVVADGELKVSRILDVEFLE